ncbi:TMF family protein [Algoriphagus sp. Y33]|uniref:TMF family protein n=1 Tax=Algoriphagus sp. Y33 TaxID=2772483 RepID=UPI001783D00C|nr:TMF family protein [Algoriphagus sp. Y33]
MNKIIISLCLLFLSGFVIAQSNTFPTTGNAGIGTLSPTSPLHVIGDIKLHGAVRVHSSDGNQAGALMAIGDPTTQNGLQLDAHRGSGYILFSTNSASGTREKMRIQNNGNVGIGTNNPTYKLSVNGTIKTQEVNVTTAGWADYVFTPEYQLMPLSELEAFIQRNGHLPDVPTEAEVMENGVNLAEMNVKLLEKVEELTLYVIELESKVENQESTIEKLFIKLENIDSMLSRLVEEGNLNSGRL